MTIALHMLSPSASHADLFGSPAVPLATDWFGEPLASAIKIHLGLGGDRILFGAEGVGSPRCADATPGAFIEGLRESDVVELFLGEPGSTRYQEFNLSPRGAWWTMGFSGYRVRMTTNPMPGVRCYADVVGEVWRTAIVIPLRELTIAWVPDAGTLNVTAIHGLPQQFATAVDLGGGEPDFHRAERFPRVRIVG